jgi:hypothetical protein
MRKLISFLIIVFTAQAAFALELESEVFEDKGYIPDRYTCDAQNFSPPLGWSNVPENTQSLVLVCDDPDAPFKIWVHWVAFNIPPQTLGFKEDISQKELGELGVIEGVNDFGKAGYQGPCPPAGKAHRYSFKLYALDTILSLQAGVSRKDVVGAMQGHIIAEAKLTGFYQRASSPEPKPEPEVEPEPELSPEPEKAG